MGGFASGFVGAAGNALLKGQKFGKSLLMGLKAGFFSGVAAGVLNGVSAGLKATKNGGNFWSGKRPEVNTVSTLKPQGIEPVGLPKPKGDLSGLEARPEIANTWDKVTNKRILGLNPELQPKATSFINIVDSELGVKLRITDGLRSIEEQNILYAQGRTTPGNIVTHAKGGESLHNFGKAFDVVQIKNGTPIWNKLSDEIVSIGNELGLKWGGHWNTFKDYPHFYIK